MMVPISRRGADPHSGADTRPIAFLVSTTGAAKGIKTSLGTPAYSYFFVFQALAPVLEQFGKWTLLDRPESSLPFVAARAEADGFRPVHLAIHPPQDVYLTPAVPNIIFPFWEFPDIPDRDFDYDTRQNWVRVSNRADLIITACHFTADAFHRARIKTPVAVVPVPLQPEHFQVPDWDPDHAWTLTCRHVAWGRPSPQDEAPAVEAADAVEASSTPKPRRSWKSRAYGAGRGLFRKAYPWLGSRTLERVARARHYLVASAGFCPQTMAPLPGPKPGLVRLAYAVARDQYRRRVARWLSPEALSKITRIKARALRVVGREPILAPDPLLPSTPLTLGGLVFASTFNLGDRRKNHVDLLSAYLLAFRDRQDATLVIKLATSPAREHHEIGTFRKMYEALHIRHECRLVVITDFLTDQQMRELTRATTFYVNTSRAEGACLPLQQALAAGRPAIAPDHTSMSDYMDESVGFVVGSHDEPTCWPHDPELRTETTWKRLIWSDLRDGLLEAAAMYDDRPEDYRAMADAARARMAAYAGREVVTRALSEALEHLPEVQTGRFAWAS
ncbi:glycosyltransferase [Tundrisphaera sp. TA3]|uniref:glycosyltransferase n=1 Tax=Tundrisphaera sp. TA3 TaxID=3435775 RepID=UPI003EB865EC